MSIIKTTKAQLGLGPAAENHFWESTPNQLSLKRGTPDAPGAELIKALNGVLSFPNQGQSLDANGYVKLPGGLIVQWGSATNPGNAVVGFPIPFPTVLLSITANISVVIPDDQLRSVTVELLSLSQFKLHPRGFAAGGAFIASGDVFWLAIGY